MPSPFPGMDPYLEHPDHFPQLHDQLITHSAEELQRALPEPYFAKTGRRAWIEYGQRYIEPDVSVHRPESRRPGNAKSGSAVLEQEVSQPVIVAFNEFPDDEYQEPFIEIYTGRGEDKRLVTSIEILSPANKSVGPVFAKTARIALQPSAPGRD